MDRGAELVEGLASILPLAKVYVRPSAGNSAQCPLHETHLTHGDPGDQRLGLVSSRGPDTVGPGQRGLDGLARSAFEWVVAQLGCSIIGSCSYEW
jgi:hypothetical protein